MFAGGLLLACTLIFFAIWLQWTENNGWPNDSFDKEDDEEYLTRRKKFRKFVNALIFICGILVLAATVAGVGLVFLAAWSSVSLILLVILCLACVDAFRTHRHHQDKLRRLRERAFEE